MQMELRDPFQINALASKEQIVNYQFIRAVIESVEHGSHYFVSQGEIQTIELSDPNHGIQQTAIQDNRTFDGWRKLP